MRCNIRKNLGYSQVNRQKTNPFFMAHYLLLTIKKSWQSRMIMYLCTQISPSPIFDIKKKGNSI